MTYIVLDSSSMISLSDSCIFTILKGLNKKLDLQFFIPKAVESESVIRPLRIKRFELNALRIEKGLNEGWLQTKNISEKGSVLVNEILDTFNNLFFIKGNALKIIQLGEVEALALLKDLNAKIYVVDERTTRLLIEKPTALKKLLERRHKTKVKMHKENLFKLKQMFKDIVVIRSTELVALAARQGILSDILFDSPNALEAALYSVKFNGCGISETEIKAFLKKEKNKYKH